MPHAKGRPAPTSVRGAPSPKRLPACYQQAIEHDYRFFSFGDAMLIL